MGVCIIVIGNLRDMSSSNKDTNQTTKKGRKRNETLYYYLRGSNADQYIKKQSNEEERKSSSQQKKSRSIKKNKKKQYNDTKDTNIKKQQHKHTKQKDNKQKERQSTAQTEQRDINFLSFDLGGSGLKFMPLSIVNDDVEDDKIVRRIGSEVNLGRIPGHYKQPRDWIETIISEVFDTDDYDYNKLSFKSLKEWPDFGLAGRDNTFKLWAEKEYEAVFILTKDDTNNLSIGCKNITTTDIPNWVKSKGVI